MPVKKKQHVSTNTKIDLKPHSIVDINLYDAYQYKTGIDRLRAILLGAQEKKIETSNLIGLRIHSYEAQNDTHKICPVFFMDWSAYIVGYQDSTNGIQKRFEKLTYTQQTQFNFGTICADRDTMDVIAHVVSEAVRFEPVFCHVESLIRDQNFVLNIISHLCDGNSKFWYYKVPHSDSGFADFIPLTIQELRNQWTKNLDYWLLPQLKALPEKDYVYLPSKYLLQEHIEHNKILALDGLVEKMIAHYRDGESDDGEEDYNSQDDESLCSNEEKTSDFVKKWHDSWVENCINLFDAIKLNDEGIETKYQIFNTLLESNMVLEKDCPVDKKSVIRVPKKISGIEDSSIDTSNHDLDLNFINIIKAERDLHKVGLKLPEGMCIIDIPGEGHGFFRVLAKVLPQEASDIRQTVFNHMNAKYKSDSQERLKSTLQQGDLSSAIFQDIIDALKINITLYKIGVNPINLNIEGSSSVNIAYVSGRYWLVGPEQYELTVEEESAKMVFGLQYMLNNFDMTITEDSDGTDTLGEQSHITDES